MLLLCPIKTHVYFENACNRPGWGGQGTKGLFTPHMGNRHIHIHRMLIEIHKRTNTQLLEDHNGHGSLQFVFF